MMNGPGMLMADIESLQRAMIRIGGIDLPDDVPMDAVAGAVSVMSDAQLIDAIAKQNQALRNRVRELETAFRNYIIGCPTCTDGSEPLAWQEVGIPDGILIYRLGVAHD